MRGTRYWIFCTALIFSALHLQGQVKFKVELLPDGITYRVSMLPEVTWNPPLNITSTAQITLKVPTGGFGVTSLASQQPGTFWSQNARYNQPFEAPAYDYISFGLTSLGTTGFSYQAGVEVPLFTFVNNGVCTGGVEIMPNGDPFFPPNSLNANVNNQITTLGTGLGSNGFAGIYDAGSANCLAAAACSVSFELDMLADGTYQISLVPDTTWLPPANTTDSLQVTLVAPAGSFVLGSLQSLVNGASFSAGASFPAPAENPDFDYFTIRLQATTTGIAFIQNSKTPLFTFKNLGSCSGDTLSLPDFQNDPFLDVSPAARMRIKTNGSVSGIYACVSGGGQPMQPVISSVSSISSSDCNAPNGLVTVSAGSSPASLVFSLDGGASWQPDNVFMNLSGGSYQAAARFSNGTCPVFFAQNPIVLTAPEAPEIQSISKTNPTGCGSDDGSIVVQATSPSGVGGSLEYSITGGAFWQTSNIFGGLTAGSYSVKVRTSDGACTVDGGVQTLNSAGAAPQVFSANATPPSTCAGNNGSIVISASGSGSLQFSINNGFTWSSSNVFTGLKNGNYNVLVRSQPGGCVGVFAGNPVVLQTPGCGGCLIEYELELLPDGRYQVSMTPDTTWLFPQSITGTAQVTIVAPTGGFHVVNLTNLQPGVEFLDNVRVNAPAENPGYDYISFGLQTLGTAGIPYQKGVKVPLFTFENGGICTGQNVFLMDDNTDPFSPPNSANSNAGQQLTTVGSGSDAFVCIVQPGFVPCSPEPQNHLEAVDDAFSGFANSLLAGNILTNDLNPNQNVLTVNPTPLLAPTHGTLSLNSNGTFIFHPDPNFTGTDVFQYLGCDDGTLFALDLRDGSPRWKLATGAGVRSSPAVPAGVVYVGYDDGGQLTDKIRRQP
ncbi:MAG: Ig-like domain-containing protein, partial [Bacteroidota bacterium]